MKRRTSKQAAQRRAADALAKVKPYEEWLATAAPVQLEAAARIAGSTRRAYDVMVRELTQMAGADCPIPENLK